MKYCPQCAKEYEDDKEFCSEDANPLISKTADFSPATTALTCTQCGKPLPGGRRFCLYCGTPTGAAGPELVLCPACGELMPGNALFCGACGTGIRARNTVPLVRPGTVPPPTLTQTVQRQEWQRGVWLGAGACLAAFVLLGIGVVLGTRISSEDRLVATKVASKPPENPGSQPQSPPSSIPDLLPGRHTIIAAEPVPVRKNPSEEAETIGKASPGKKVVVVRTQGSWVEIRSPSGEPGYIPRDAVSTELAADGET